MSEIKKQIPEKIINFLNAWTDEYHERTNVRAGSRGGVLLAGFLELSSLLDNHQELVPFFGLIELAFGTPILINFIREKRKYYKSIEYEREKVKKEKREDEARKENLGIT